jgi:hypothetical protein
MKVICDAKETIIPVKEMTSITVVYSDRAGSKAKWQKCTILSLGKP